MGAERFFKPEEIIVSKADLKGRLTYANQTFIDISGYTEAELIGQPHSILRHPAMPRCVFKLLWDTIGQGREIFAYVINKTKNNDYYWVFAHVTPSFDAAGQIISYHSNRRVPDHKVIDETIAPLYAALLAEEEKYENRKDGLQAGFDMLVNILKQKGMAYDELIFALAR